jgi:ribosomal subunit interface protein
MRLTTKYTNLDHSPILDQYINEKFSKLERLVEKFDLEGAVEARVEVARTTKHHQKGPVYRAEINLKLPHKLLRADQEDWDIRVAIDQTKDKIEREVIKYKETN